MTLIPHMTLILIGSLVPGSEFENDLFKLRELDSQSSWNKYVLTKLRAIYLISHAIKLPPFVFTGYDPGAD